MQSTNSSKHKTVGPKCQEMQYCVLIDCRHCHLPVIHRRIYRPYRFRAGLRTGSCGAPQWHRVPRSTDQSGHSRTLRNLGQDGSENRSRMVSYQTKPSSMSLASRISPAGALTPRRARIRAMSRKGVRTAKHLPGSELWHGNKQVADHTPCLSHGCRNAEVRSPLLLRDPSLQTLASPSPVRQTQRETTLMATNVRQSLNVIYRHSRSNPRPQWRAEHAWKNTLIPSPYD